MGQAILGSHRFRLDPSSVRWNFNIKTSDVKTVGGKVIQVFGATLGEMTLTGSFGVGGRKEQAAFLETMKKMAREQVKNAAVRNSTEPLLRFLYPPRGWDFRVYLMSYLDPQSGGYSVRLRQDAMPKWTLTLLIVQDTSNLIRVAQDAYIARLAEGLGWKQTQYNGGTQADASRALAGRSAAEYLATEGGYGIAVTGGP